MPSGPRKIHDFCWINVLTPNPPAAQNFFGTLLGWSYTEMPPMGHGIMLDGKRVGGMFDLADPNTPAGTPPQIGVMVKVASADETAARVAALGGSAMPSFDIGPEGRMAVCHDPNGAQFDIWEPKRSPGADVDSVRHGAPSWFETMTTNAPRAREFYVALFGWTAADMPMPDFNYTTFSLDGVPVAGAYPIMPQMADMGPRWDLYFTVDNADDALRHALSLGGSECVPATDIPNIGRFAGIVSPQGVMFYVIQYLS